MTEQKGILTRARWWVLPAGFSVIRAATVAFKAVAV